MTPQKPAKTQRKHRREKFCVLAEFLRFSGVNGLFQGFLFIYLGDEGYL